MSDVVMEIIELEKSFGGIKALSNFSCVLQSQEILGLIGPNGAGKTTLFNVISGFLAAESGKVLFKGKDISGASPQHITNTGISRTFQTLRLVRQMSVLDNILLSFRNQPGEKLWNIFFDWRHSHEVEERNHKEAATLLEMVGLSHKSGAPAQELSYGEQKLLNLTCCLAAKSDVILLDEPVAGIAPVMIEKTIETIRGLPAMGKSVIIIEHNLNAVMQVCDRVIFMDAGAKVSEGTPEEVSSDPRVIDAYIN